MNTKMKMFLACYGQISISLVKLDPDSFSNETGVHHFEVNE